MLFPLLAMLATTPAQSSPAGEAPAVNTRPASIAFANHGGIRNWEAINDHIVLIEGSHRRWFLATLLAPCNGIRFTETVGFITEPNGSFDRFSSILVRGQKCPLKSFEIVTGQAAAKLSTKPLPLPMTPQKTS
jgi:hypothetical protein